MVDYQFCIDAILPESDLEKRWPVSDRWVR